MARLSIEAISVFGLPPVDYVTLAADLGCRHISTGLTAYPYNPHDYPPFSLRDDAALRREMKAAMRDTGVTISLGEGFTLRPEAGAASFTRDLDIFAELGAPRVNTLGIDPDLPRTLDQFGLLAEAAAARGIETTIEFLPGVTIGDLPSALAAVRHVARPDFRLLIDTMHLVRTGSGPAEIAAIDPDLIAYVQLCDAPLLPRFDTYHEEAVFERMAPGEGELGLREVVAVLPGERVYGLEVPLRREAEAGIGPRERLGKCVAAARRLLAEAGHGMD